MLVTRENLCELLQREDLRQHVIGRALLVLHNRQTYQEQSSLITRETNERGFTHADARSGSITAMYYRKHSKLEGWQVDRWMKLAKNGYPRITKYWAQLNEEAEIKQVEKGIK